MIDVGRSSVGFDKQVLGCEVELSIDDFQGIFISKYNRCVML